MTQAALNGLDGAISPLPQPGVAVALRASAVLTAAWVATDVVSVRNARRVTLFCAYAADAGGTANRAQIRVMASAEDAAGGTAPTVATDVWYPPAIVDATATATLLTGTKETGATMTTTQPEHGVVVARPLAITLGEPADAGTDVGRMAITLEVGPYRWLYVAAKELGDTDADQLGILGIKWNVSL
jgi:hypothetical protein